MGQEWSQRVAGDCPERSYTPEETITHVRTLIEVDKQYAECVKKGLYGFLGFRMADMAKSDEVREAVSNPEYVRLSGSCADGGAICRWFRRNIPDVELDITYQVGVIPADQDTSILAPIPEKPGFLKVYNARETYKCLHPLLRQARPALCEQFNTQRTGQTFVNTTDMQEDVSQIWPHMDGHGRIPKACAFLMGVDESALRQEVTEKVEGPSNLLEIIVYYRNEPAVAYSSDSVLTLKVERFPEEMKPCLERFSKFLPPDVMEKMGRAHTYIVAKKSPGERTVEEWRRSTTEMEHILISTWREPGNDQKMVCYFTLKCLFYRYIRGIEFGDKHITSYALKTAMFWMVETMDPAEWTDANFMKNLKKVLNHLLNDLRNHNVPNYFIPEMNVIDPSEYPSDLTDAVAAKLAEMIQNLEAFMPCDLEKMIKIGQAIIGAMNLILIYFNFMTISADQR